MRLQKHKRINQLNGMMTDDCKNWDLLVSTPSWSFVQAKWCKWLVSKDKRLWAPLIFCFFSCDNKPGQKFAIWHQHLSKPFGVFGEVYKILLKNVQALLIYFHLRDYKTKKLSRRTSSSLSTWVNNAILGGIPIAETHTPGVANSWVPSDLVSVTLWRRLRSTMMTATQIIATATTPPTTPIVTTWTGTDESFSSSTTVSADDAK